MNRRNLLVVGIAFAALLTVSATPALAQEKEKAKPNAFTKTIAHAVITCIRPSTAFAEKGYEPSILSHKFTRPKARRLDLEVRMRWYGLWTKSPYESQFKIKMEVDGATLEILGIDYTDDCLIPAPDMRLLNALIRELNKKFAEASGKGRSD